MTTNAPDARQVPPWRRQWLLAFVAVTFGVSLVLAVVIAFGEFDVTWLASLAITLACLAAFSALIEYVRWRLLTRQHVAVAQMPNSRHHGLQLAAVQQINDAGRNGDHRGMKLRFVAALLIVVCVGAGGVVPILFLAVGWWILSLAAAIGAGAAASLYTAWRTNESELTRQGFKW